MVKSKFKARIISAYYKEGNTWKFLELNLFKSIEGSQDGLVIVIDGEQLETDQKTVSVVDYYPTILYPKENNRE